MSSVLRPVRKRKKGRTLGPVEIIRREDYADLELDAKVELQRAGRLFGFGVSRAADSPCRGERDAAAVVRGVAGFRSFAVTQVPSADSWVLCVSGSQSTRAPGDVLGVRG